METGPTHTSVTLAHLFMPTKPSFSFERWSRRISVMFPHPCLDNLDVICQEHTCIRPERVPTDGRTALRVPPSEDWTSSAPCLSDIANRVEHNVIIGLCREDPPALTMPDPLKSLTVSTRSCVKTQTCSHCLPRAAIRPAGCR